MGQAVKRLTKSGIDTSSQKCVSFTETPLEHVSLLVGDIKGRQCSFESYGVAITKKQGRMAGVNPVWYVDITPGHNWLTKYIDQLIDDAIKIHAFNDSTIAKLSPFFEQMGTQGGNYKKEFWWEREWRVNGDFFFPFTYIVLCPEGEISEFKAITDNSSRSQHVSFVDPKWSLEQIIARLAFFRKEEVDPF